MSEPVMVVEEILDAIIEDKTKKLIQVKEPALIITPDPEVSKANDIVTEKEAPVVIEEKPPERRGRPRGSSDNKPVKIKLKPSPKSAIDSFKQEFKGLGLIAVYGVDEFTDKLVRSLWSDPQINFIVTDPVDQRSANLTRSIGSLPFSIYRYVQKHPNGFIESGKYPVIIVAEEYWERVNKLPNPNGVTFTCLSHWGRTKT